MLPIHFSNYFHLIAATPLTLETAILYGYMYSLHVSVQCYGPALHHTEKPKAASCSLASAGTKTGWIRTMGRAKNNIT